MISIKKMEKNHCFGSGEPLRKNKQTLWLNIQHKVERRRCGLMLFAFCLFIRVVVVELCTVLFIGHATVSDYSQKGCMVHAQQFREP